MRKFVYLLPVSMMLSLLFSCTAEELPEDYSKNDPYYANSSGGEESEPEDPPADGN